MYRIIEIKNLHTKKTKYCVKIKRKFIFWTYYRYFGDRYNVYKTIKDAIKDVNKVYLNDRRFYKDNMVFDYNIFEHLNTEELKKEFINWYMEYKNDL